MKCASIGHIWLALRIYTAEGNIKIHAGSTGNRNLERYSVGSMLYILLQALKDSVGVIATATAAIVNEIVPAIDAVKNDVLSARQAIDHALTTAKDLIVAGALKATTDIRDQIKKVPRLLYLA